MKSIIKLLLIFIILGSMTLGVCSCVVSPRYSLMREQGYYPKSEDLPNTKWVCDEYDMYFYIFDYGENYMTGEYSHDGITYRLIAQFDFSALDFNFYTNTVESVSTHQGNNSSNFLHAEREIYAHLYTEYIYRENMICCTVKNSDIDLFCEGDEIKFEKAQSIDNTYDKQYFCEELQMSIGSFAGVDGYYKGEIVIEGEKCPIQALEIGNSNYYKISIQNGYTNNLTSDSSSDLVNMFFYCDGVNIIAKITDDHLENSNVYTYWKYNQTMISFIELDEHNV